MFYYYTVFILFFLIYSIPTENLNESFLTFRLYPSPGHKFPWQKKEMHVFYICQKKVPSQNSDAPIKYFILKYQYFHP